MELDLTRPAVFLDRDGVLVVDEGAITHSSQVHLMPGVPSALRALHDAGALLVVVSNQTALARGLLDEKGVLRIQGEIEDRLFDMGAPKLDGFYYCGHHPNATLPMWRSRCQCRKPAPGMITKAAAELHVDLSKSYMIGDRPTDIAAGKNAGCRTVLVQTGRHTDPPIQTWDHFKPIDPDLVCDDLQDASERILKEAAW